MQFSHCAGRLTVPCSSIYMCRANWATWRAEFDALMTDLRNQRAELATITDASPMGLFRCDTMGQMVYVNDAYLEIHRLARADADSGLARAWSLNQQGTRCGRTGWRERSKTSRSMSRGGCGG